MNTQEATEIIAADVNARLDDLLSRWDHWAQTQRVTKGYAPKALVCGDFRISRQYDYDNGAMDADIEDGTMKVVHFHLAETPEPYRSALYCQARNLRLGLDVWASPRLPGDPMARAQVLASGRSMIVKRLTLAGVM